MFNPSGANPPKWSNTLKQFVDKNLKVSFSLPERDHRVNKDTTYKTQFNKIALKDRTYDKLFMVSDQAK